MKGKWLILISVVLLLAGIRTGWEVYEGYKKGLVENGLQVNPELVYISEDMEMNNLEKGYAYIKRILENTERENSLYVKMVS